MKESFWQFFDIQMAIFQRVRWRLTCDLGVGADRETKRDTSQGQTGQQRLRTQIERRDHRHGDVVQASRTQQ